MNKKSIIITIAVLAIIIGSISYHMIAKKIAGINMAKAMSAPTRVETKAVEKTSIHDSIDFVGRIEAEKEIKIVSRVNGWLQKKFYKDGDFVKQGQLLLQIEPDEYALAVQNAEAALKQIQASYDNSAVELKRAKELVKGDYVSRSYYDKVYAQYASDKAGVESAKASLARARLNLSYTKIYAPYDGKIGELLIQQGNYVTAQTGEIAKLITVDPIYASFTMKQNDLARFNLKPNSRIPDAKITIQLADGTTYDEEGILDFMDNQIDKDLGTITMRATFNNKNKKLIPNDFVRVTLTANNTTDVLLVPQNAVLENVNSKYVWVIDEKNTAKQQDIEVFGPYKEFWIVKSGIKEGDIVISSNIQSIHQGTKIQVVELTDEEKEKKAKARHEAITSNSTIKPNQKQQAEKAE